MMIRRTVRGALVPVVALAATMLVLGCREEAERYELRGQVTDFDEEKGTVTVAHEPIPDFMDGMTMPFRVRERWVFDSVGEGDRIVATLVVQGASSWLEEVVLSRSQATDAEAGPPEPELGSQVPDVTLTNQNGETVRLSDYRGKTVALTFIYTRCPLPDFCPRMTSQFESLELALREDPELYQRTHLLTISFDPEFDTPELLTTYARQQTHVDGEFFDHWEFATGDDEELRRIGDFVGLTYVDAHGEIVHNLRTALVAPDGTLALVLKGNSWEAAELLEAIENGPASSPAP